MSAITEVTEVYVVVQPVSWRFNAHRDAETCREIAAAIKRHVDDVATVEVVEKKRVICEYCDCEWEPEFDGPDGPGCCQAAISEWKARKVAE